MPRIGNKKVRIGKQKYQLVAVALLISIVGVALTFRAFMAPLYGVLNPTLSQSCGLDIALVLDDSASISQSQLTQMKSAMKSFATTFGGTETQLAVITFHSAARVVQPFTTNVNRVVGAINGIASTNGNIGTNWRDALTKAQATFDPRPNKPNLIIFATDGQPYPSSASGYEVADTIKQSGTRILMLGIMNNASPPLVENMKHVSGPKVNQGGVLTSDVITTSFEALATDLATFANQTCGNKPGPFKGSNKGTQTGNKSGTVGPGKGSGGSTAQKPSPKPNPTPKTSSQGDNKKDPEPEPSPFYDGKIYPKKSEVDKFTSNDTVSERGSTNTAILLGSGLLVLTSSALVIRIFRRRMP